MKTTISLTRVEVDHLVNLLVDAQASGSYYGPKNQYWKRHQRIWDKLRPPSECRNCDGCSWYEGGPTLKTTCTTCSGSGIEPRAT